MMRILILAGSILALSGCRWDDGLPNDNPATGDRQVGFLTTGQLDQLPMDLFRMDTAFIEGDSLRLQVSYSGGCRDHEFRLWKLPSQPVELPPIELLLAHEANGDMCEAWLTRWLAFSLVPLRRAGLAGVDFLLRGSPEMSAYYGHFTYRY